MHEKLRSINQTGARMLANDKLAFYEYCLSWSLPTIPVICAIQDDLTSYSESSIIVESEERWSELLDVAPARVFIKPIDGSRGRGAFTAEKKDGIWHYAGVYGTAVSLYRHLRERMAGKRGWMVQPIVAAHRDLKNITSGNALPTIRANTCLVDGIPRLLFAVLRIPVGNNVTDNFAHGTTGNIVAPIDLETGRLGRCRGSSSKTWPVMVDIDLHPDTGNVIEGYQLPYWSEAVILLNRAQKSLPNLKTLGWDIAITDDGPVIVETNATYDIDIVQVAYQRGVRSEIENILGVVP